MSQAIVIENILWSGDCGGAIFNGASADGAKFRFIASSAVMPRPPLQGEVWSISGVRRKHPEHGEQVEVSHCVLQRPSGRLITKVLAGSRAFPGIGAVTARKLWDEFGETLYMLLDQGLPSTFAGLIGAELAAALISGWQEMSVEADVYRWLDAHGVPMWIAKKLIAIYGNEVVEKLEENPYRLLAFTNWTQADRLGRASGIALDDDRRLVAAADAAVYARIRSHHTWTPCDVFLQLLSNLLGSDDTLAEPSFQLALRDRAVIELNGGVQGLGPYSMEVFLAERFAEMMRGDFQSTQMTIRQTPDEAATHRLVAGVEADNKIVLNAEQKAAVHLALTAPLAVISGGAGTGKTTVLSAICSIFETLGAQVYQLALSGRAARRIQEATGRPAQTIASWLAYSATNSMLQTASGPATTGTNIQSVTYNYDTSGRLWTVVHTQSGAQIAQYSYNTSNQLVDVTRMDGLKPVTTTADAKGRSSVRKNARGNSNTWSFYKNSTDRSRVTSAFDASSGLSAWEQGADSSGRQTYIKDPLNNYTLYGYTGSSLLPTSVQLPTVGRPAITIARNSFGLPTTITDPAIPGAQPTQIKYTGANLPWQVTDAAGRATEVDYTTSNNVKKLRQYHNGQAVETTCDYLNEYLHTVTDPLSHTWTYGRDSVGRVTSASDPTGVTISCDYDALGRLWHIYDPKLSSPVVYGYDSLNRVQTITTPTGTTSYVYDPITKWLQSTTVATTDGKTRTLVYGYNSQTGDVTSTTYQYPATTGGTTSITTNYGYTDYGALNSVTPPGAEPINFNVNALGQTLGTSESNAGLTVGPSITANNATSSAWTNQSSQIFVWGAPPSSLPITGYNYAEDTATSLTVNTTGLTAAWNSVADGQHAFRVRGQDSGGNWSPESVFNLWVDTTPPAITGVSNTPSPIPKSTTSAVATANISDALSGLGSNIPQLRWCISADATRNWNAYTNMTQGTGNQWSSSISVNWSQYAGQTLYYQIQAQDAAGNISTITNSDSINASTGVLAMSLWMRISLVSLLFVAIARLLPRKPVSIG